MGPLPYTDRDHAGRVLAEQLADHTGQDDVLVLGLTRGGVPVAARVAAGLRAELDLLVVRKLGLPGQAELAMGAVAGAGRDVEVVRNDEVLIQAHVADDVFDRVCRRETAELRRRESAYRRGRARTPVTGRLVIMVDDGLATGSTMLAAVAAVRRQQPERLVVAIPVGSVEARATVREHVDDLVCPWTPTPFIAVGHAYLDFSATSDATVRTALAPGG